MGCVGFSLPVGCGGMERVRRGGELGTGRTWQGFPSAFSLRPAVGWAVVGFYPTCQQQHQPFHHWNRSCRVCSIAEGLDLLLPICLGPRSFATHRQRSKVSLIWYWLDKMAGFLRARQAGIQNDLSAGIAPTAFNPDELVRYGIRSQIRYVIFVSFLFFLCWVPT